MAGEEALSARRRRVRPARRPGRSRADAGRGRGGPPAPAGARRAGLGGTACRLAAICRRHLRPIPTRNTRRSIRPATTRCIGCTIGEVGSVAASMHKCQGRSPIQNFGGASGARYRLAATVIEAQKNKDETSLFEGVDTSLTSLLQYGGAKPPAALRDGIAAITTSRHRARRRRSWARRIPRSRCRICWPVSPRSARCAPGLGSMGLSDAGKYEIDFRLKQKEDQFQQAIMRRARAARSTRSPTTASSWATSRFA